MFDEYPYFGLASAERRKTKLILPKSYDKSNFTHQLDNPRIAAPHVVQGVSSYVYT
jgi:hypothetical protein